MEDRERENSTSDKMLHRPWWDLPHDVLRLIMEELFLADEIRFRGVCKDWMLDLQYPDKLPWIMSYRVTPSRGICRFFEPTRRQSHVVEEKRSETLRKLFSATVCSSRLGWLLFSKAEDSGDGFTSFSVYNPLSKEIISLPNLGCPCVSRLATFSSPPTSPDCVFFAPHHCTVDYFVISTFKVGDEAWEIHGFSASPPWCFSGYGVAYLDGIFYCCTESGNLSSFNVGTREWKLLSAELDYNFSSGKSYFLAYGGDLLLVILRELGVASPDCSIFRFDWSGMTWTRIESLEGGAVFLGDPSFGVAAMEQTRMIANRVYYFTSHTSIPKFLTYGLHEEIKSVSQTALCYPPSPHDFVASKEIRTWMQPPPLNVSNYL